MLKLSKQQLYEMSDKSISFETFSDSLDRVQELVAQLQTFNSKDEAIEFIMKETNGEYETCAKAYDFYIHLFAK